MKRKYLKNKVKMKWFWNEFISNEDEILFEKKLKLILKNIFEKKGIVN